MRKENDQFVLNIGEITSDEREQLIVLCKWKIPNSPLNLEELIEAFNKNMNLFDPDGYDPSQKRKRSSNVCRKIPVREHYEYANR